jgi:hypothetical protein
MLLLWHALRDLGIIPKNFPNPRQTQSPLLVKSASSSDSIDQCAVHGKIHGIMAKFPEVFDSSSQLKPMKGTQMHIYLKDNINEKPTHLTTARNIPFAYREKAEKEIIFMQESGIIEPANEPSDWVSPSIVVPKPNGSIRFVVDYTGLNKFVRRPIHPFQSPTELLTSIPSSSKWFVVLDAVKGYWQVELDKRSRALTTFLTPFGRFRFCRAPMGLNASGDKYCARGDRALSGLKGIKKIVDDIIIFGSNLEELAQRTEAVLQRCLEHGITLSMEKAQVGESVKFAGFIVNSSGIAPDPSKMAAIADFPKPANLTDLRSFLGLANQLGQFVPDLAHAMQPLRGLLKKDFAFQWLDDHDKAFAAVKAILTNPKGPVLAHFDSSLPTTLLTDTSRLKSLGFALLQTKPDGSTILVQCGSRFLSDAETRYAVCELEALAIQWAIHRCRLYLLGIMFKVITDHKPLTGIFKGSNLDAVDNPRLQRILQKVAGYTFYVEWVPGKTHQIADALSRAPVFDPEEADKSNQDIAVVSAVSITSDPAITKLSAAANLDINYQAIISAL